MSTPTPPGSGHDPHAFKHFNFGLPPKKGLDVRGTPTPDGKIGTPSPLGSQRSSVSEADGKVASVSKARFNMIESDFADQLLKGKEPGHWMTITMNPHDKHIMYIDAKKQLQSVTYVQEGDQMLVHKGDRLLAIHEFFKDIAASPRTIEQKEYVDKEKLILSTCEKGSFLVERSLQRIAYVEQAKHKDDPAQIEYINFETRADGKLNAVFPNGTKEVVASMDEFVEKYLSSDPPQFYLRNTNLWKRPQFQ